MPLLRIHHHTTPVQQQLRLHQWCKHQLYTPIAPTPVVQTPVVHTPVAPTPEVQTPVVRTPIAPVPIVQTPVVHTSCACTGCTGTSCTRTCCPCTSCAGINCTGTECARTSCSGTRNTDTSCTGPSRADTRCTGTRCTNTGCTYTGGPSANYDCTRTDTAGHPTTCRVPRSRCYITPARADNIVDVDPLPSATLVHDSGVQYSAGSTAPIRDVAPDAELHTATILHQARMIAAKRSHDEETKRLREEQSRRMQVAKSWLH
jgi:hypothetical protein